MTPGYVTSDSEDKFTRSRAVHPLNVSINMSSRHFVPNLFVPRHFVHEAIRALSVRTKAIHTAAVAIAYLVFYVDVVC